MANALKKITAIKQPFASPSGQMPNQFASRAISGAIRRAVLLRRSAGAGRSSGRIITFKAAADLKFCVGTANSLNRRAAAPLFHKLCNQVGSTNASLGLGQITFNSTAQRCYEQRMYAPASRTALRSSVIYLQLRSATADNAFGCAADFSNNRLFVLKI